MLDRISRLEDSVRRLMEGDAVDLEDKKEASDKLSSAGTVAEQIHRDKPFQRFLQQHISEEYRDDDREEPLCRCSYAECALKNGTLPGRVRRADDLQSGIDEFQERHPNAIILLEARQKWLEQLSEYRSLLREVHADLEEARANSKPRGMA